MIISGIEPEFLFLLVTGFEKGVQKSEPLILIQIANTMSDESYSWHPVNVAHSFNTCV